MIVIICLLHSFSSKEISVLNIIMWELLTFLAACSVTSSTSFIGIVIRIKKRRSVLDGQKTCNSKGESLIGIKKKKNGYLYLIDFCLIKACCVTTYLIKKDDIIHI